MTSSYPELRGCRPPAFLSRKYGSIRALLEDVARRGQETLPPLDIGKFIGSFPTVESAFAATAGELASALGTAFESATRYRAILQRLMIWEDMDEVAATLSRIFDQVIVDMPRRLKDVEEGGGGRDVLDPFIVGFASRLLSSGSVPDLLRLLIAHKCMMKLEDLIGHLHEETLGRAAGAERVPEPQGVADASGRRNKEVWHPTLNPYPGADARHGESEFYQIKNKTGSAKGSDGEKLGRQFQELAEHYPESSRYYVSMIGRTLSGHRSMGAFLRNDPGAEVLVGLSAFQQLGQHRDTPDIILELYLETFEEALKRNHYDYERIVAEITHEWVEKHGSDDPIQALVQDMILPSDRSGANQSSRTYQSGVRRGRRGEQLPEER